MAKKSVIDPLQLYLARASGLTFRECGEMFGVTGAWCQMKFWWIYNRYIRVGRS